MTLEMLDIYSKMQIFDYLCPDTLNKMRFALSKNAKSTLKTYFATRIKYLHSKQEIITILSDYGSDSDS